MKQEIIRKLSAAVAMSLVVGVSLAACGGGSSSTAAGVTLSLIHISEPTRH